MTTREIHKAVLDAQMLERLLVVLGVHPFAKKHEYIARRRVFAIFDIEQQKGAGYGGCDCWFLTVLPNDGRGAEIITLSCNDQRDAHLRAARERVEKNGPMRGMMLAKSGHAYYLRKFPTKPV